jgi:excisionase family DNA binding protein
MKLLTRDEVAKILDVPPRTIDHWIRTGRIKPLKAGRLNRFTMRHVEDFLKVRRGTLSDAKPSSTTADARK